MKTENEIKDWIEHLEKMIKSDKEYLESKTDAQLSFENRCLMYKDIERRKIEMSTLKTVLFVPTKNMLKGFEYEPKND